MTLSLANLLADGARRHPERVLAHHAGSALSYADIEGGSCALANELRQRGVDPGDRVGLLAGNTPAFAVAYFAILRAGAVVVPLNILLRQREIEFHLKDCGARVLVADRARADLGKSGAEPGGVSVVVVDGAFGERRVEHEVVQRDPDDPAVIIYTSGTTGTPKGAVLTHSNLLWNAQISADLFKLEANDRLLAVLPLFHAFGQTCVMNAALRRGARIVFVERFDADEVLDTMAAQRVSVFSGVPTMFAALAESQRARPRDIGVRLCNSGGASIAAEVVKRFEQEFECPILEGYGLSETSPVTSFNHLERGRKTGSIGTPIWGVEMRLAGDDDQPPPAGEVGEVQVRGHNVMRGYHGNPDATSEAFAEGGWFRTGDLATRDGEGYYFIVGRKKDLLIRGGYNVYPREVEEVLMEHPEVLEAAVLGLPHERLGEEVGAVVALRVGASADGGAIAAFAKDRLAAYKYPRQVAIVPELPKGPTGKVVKREIDLTVFGERQQAV